MNWLKAMGWSLLVVLLTGTVVRASEADLKIPDLHPAKFFNDGDPTKGISAWDLLFYGAMVIAGTLGISLYQLAQIYKQPAHKSMLNVSEIIFQTCKTYLIQQGKFLLMLFCFIAVAIGFYFYLEKKPDQTAEHTLETIGLVLLFAVVGMGGSYALAWYGIRVNT